MARPSTRIRRIAAGVALAFAMQAAPALAEPTPADRETTRALLAEGDRRFADKDYAGALEAYSGAASIIAVPTTVIEVARAQEALGKLLEARDTYLRAARIPKAANEPAPFAPAREEASSLAAALAARIPSVVIAVRGASADVVPVVTVDGEEIPPAAALLPRQVNPGPHTVVVTATGYKTARKEAVAVEGLTRIDVALEADATSIAPPPAPPPLVVQQEKPPTLMYVGFGAGAAGLAVGTVFGLMSLSRASDAEGYCRGDQCSGAARSDKDAAIDLANVSNVGFAVAVIGAGVGIYGLLTRDKPRTTSWIVTPLGARGSF